MHDLPTWFGVLLGGIGVTAVGAVFAAGGLWVRVGGLVDRLNELINRLDHPDTGLSNRLLRLEIWQSAHIETSSEGQRRLAKLESKEE